MEGAIIRSVGSLNILPVLLIQFTNKEPVYLFT